MSIIYKHYKGNYYRLLHCATHTETLENMVVYEQLYESNYPKGHIWCRPYDMFHETIIYNTKIVKRFELVNTKEEVFASTYE